MPSTPYLATYTNSWAVVVGINEYCNVSKLGYARDDAEGFARVIHERFGFPQENIATLVDAEATLTNIQSAVHNLVRSTQRDDRAVFFFAGHGHTMSAHQRDAGFIVPVDGAVDDTSTMLHWDSLYQTSLIIPAKHMLFIMDACYGGLFGMRALAPGSSRLVRDMLSRYSRQFLTAGKANELVADAGGPRKGHSIFTGHLLDALEGGLEIKDGVLSANTVMAHVYDRVGRDPSSRQAPHYGFLAGDGDFFFLAPTLELGPSAARPSDDLMVEVPPDLIAQDEATTVSALLDQTKEYLTETRYRIKLHDLVMRALRGAQQRLGEEHFGLQGESISESEFAERLLKYEEATRDVQHVAILLGRWAEEYHDAEIRQIAHSLAGQIEMKSGLTLWLSLRYFPMLFVLYAAGIAAIDGGNYAALKTLFAVEVKSARGGEHTTVLQATCEAMLDLARADAFKTLSGYERLHTPQSEYLFKRVQPVVDDVLFLGGRYEQLFDRFEVLYALCYVDQSGGDWGHPGRFGYKYRRRFTSHDPFSALVAEAKQEGDQWAPLRAGMFSGSISHFDEVVKRFQTGLLNRLQWY
jgi:uncharacterized caspase-like protein